MREERSFPPNDTQIRVISSMEKQTDTSFKKPTLPANVDFCANPHKNVVKRGASNKKGMLSCSKCFFQWIRASLAHIQAENPQNVFFFPGVNGLNILCCVSLAVVFDLSSFYFLSLAGETSC